MRTLRVVGVLSLSCWIVACGARAQLDGDEATGGGGATAGSGNGSGTNGGTGATGGVSTSGGTGATGGVSTSGGTGATGGVSTSGGTGATGGVSTSGGTGATGGSTGTGTGPVCPSFNDACTPCLSAACPETYCNCYDNNECFALFQCTSPCNGDGDCIQKCYADHQDGISDAALLIDCAATQCPVQCPGTQGSEIDPCTKCILQDCESEMNACLAQPECLQLYNCLTSCPQLDLMCQDGCYNLYSAGIPSLQAMLNCATAECDNPCN